MQRLRSIKEAIFALFLAGFYGVAVAFVGALVFVPTMAALGFLGSFVVWFGLYGFAVMVLPGGFCWAIALALLHRSRVWWLAAFAGALPVLWNFLHLDISRAVNRLEFSSVTVLSVRVSMLLLSLIFFGGLSWLFVNRSRYGIAHYRGWQAVSAFADAAPFNSWKTERRIFVAFALPVALLALLIGAKLEPAVASNRARMARYGFWVVVQGSWRQIAPAGRNESCSNNLRQIALALAMYSQDYGERFPPVATGGQYYGWADNLQPYSRDPLFLQCPQETWKMPGNDARLPDYTDYWFNGNLSGVAATNLTSSWQTIAFGDGNDGADLTNARYNFKAMPPRWLARPDSPAFRHMDGCNFAFADGHVKWLRQPYKFAPNLGKAAGSYSFSIK